VDIITPLVVPFCIGLLVTLALTPLVILIAPVREATDLPDSHRHIHCRPVPRLGGVGVMLGALGGVLAAWSLGAFGQPDPVELRLWTALAGSVGIVLVLGLIDDLFGVPPWFKLAVQVLAAGLAYAGGFHLDGISFGHSSRIDLGVLDLPLTVLWLVGITNAFNLIDGLDGLATGIAVVALIAAAIAGALLGNFTLAPVALALAGALLGFLRYNFSPAKIFLGDSGSLSVGFLLALLSVSASRRPDGGILVSLPLFLLAFPIGDTLLAIARRWLRGSPFSAGDTRHIHHRLLALGYSHRRAAALLWAVAAGMALFGVLIGLASPALVAALATLGGLVFALIFLYGLNQLSYHEFSIARSVIVSGLGIARVIIREQIRAYELAQVLGRAGNKTEIDEQLAQAAEQFGFSYMEFNWESRLPRGLREVRGGLENSMCRIEYPVVHSPMNPDELIVLRIWCDSENYRLPSTAQRVARIVAASLAEWTEEHPDFGLTPLPHRSAPHAEALSAAPVAHV
jgi:UDP-GlcNAc:undecaprenyl-phosphate/decaprenyl-phosphate GlcNAc-1-phosphate transferase